MGGGGQRNPLGGQRTHSVVSVGSKQRRVDLHPGKWHTHAHTRPPSPPHHLPPNRRPANPANPSQSQPNQTKPRVRSHARTRRIARAPSPAPPHRHALLRIPSHKAPMVASSPFIAPPDSCERVRAVPVQSRKQGVRIQTTRGCFLAFVSNPCPPVCKHCVRAWRGPQNCRLWAIIIGVSSIVLLIVIFSVCSPCRYVFLPPYLFTFLHTCLHKGCTFIYVYRLYMYMCIVGK